MTLRSWLSRCLQWRIGWGWLAFALLFPLGGAIATAPTSGHLPLFVIDGTSQAHIPLALFVLSVVNIPPRLTAAVPPRPDGQSIDVDRSRKVDFGRTARKSAPMLMPSSSTAKMTAIVFDVAVRSRQINSLEGSLMIEWE